MSAKRVRMEDSFDEKGPAPPEGISSTYKEDFPSLPPMDGSAAIEMINQMDLTPNKRKSLTQLIPILLPVLQPLICNEVKSLLQIIKEKDDKINMSVKFSSYWRLADSHIR